MPTTTKMGIVYPASTDLVKDGATAMGTISTTVDSKTGLVLLNTTTFTNVASQSVNNVFSSNFDQYQVIINVDSGTAVVDTDLSIRLRTTVDDSGANYRNRNASISSAGATANYASGNAQTDIYGFAVNTTNKTTYGIVNFFNPNKATYTGVVGQTIGYNLGVVMNNIVTTTTQYTGFTILMGSGNATGSILTYGVNK